MDLTPDERTTLSRLTAAGAVGVMDVTATPARCATVGHATRPATHEISYNYRGETEVTRELVCGSCAGSYARLPVLADFTARPLSTP